MIATLVNNSVDTVRYVIAAAVSPGEVALLPCGRVGVAQLSVASAAGDLVEFAVQGVFDIAKASGTVIARGDDVYLDVSAEEAVETPGAVDDLYLGRAVLAAADGELTVRVALGLSRQGGLREVWASNSVTVEYNSTTEDNVIQAADNPNGLMLQLVAVVTTTIAGASQDQVILNVYDEDDNSLGSITTVDGGAAAGLTYSAWCKQLPAGKGAYIKPSQVASGSGAAGVIQARVIATRW